MTSFSCKNSKDSTSEEMSNKQKRPAFWNPCLDSSDDDDTSKDEDNHVPTDIELDEASSRRRKNGTLIMDLKEENGLENTNTDDEPNRMESSEFEVGEPAIVPTNESTSELNGSIDLKGQMEKEEDTIHHTSKITDVNQDDPEIKTNLTIQQLTTSEIISVTVANANKDKNEEVINKA